MTQTIDTTPNDDPFEPVDLDTPSPVIDHWMAICSAPTMIDHGGDASKIIPFDRPAWSEPYLDYIGRNVACCSYSSERTDIRIMSMNGIDDGEAFEPASIRVRAKLAGDGITYVGMTVRRAVEGKFIELGVNLLPDEAIEVADVLLAAVALLKGDE